MQYIHRNPSSYMHILSEVAVCAYTICPFKVFPLTYPCAELSIKMKGNRAGQQKSKGKKIYCRLFCKKAVISYYQLKAQSQTERFRALVAYNGELSGRLEGNNAFSCS